MVEPICYANAKVNLPANSGVENLEVIAGGNNDRLEEACKRLEAIADRIFGASPSERTNDACGPGLIGQLRRCDGLINLLFEQLNRFS